MRASTFTARVATVLRQATCTHPIEPLRRFVDADGTVRIAAECSLCGRRSPGIDVTPRLRAFVDGQK